jgi:hypothetical protein
MAIGKVALDIETLPGSDCIRDAEVAFVTFRLVEIEFSIDCEAYVD